MIEAHKKNPQWAKAQSEKMKTDNPAKRPEVKEKVQKYWNEFGHPLSRMQLRGGNGRPIPKAQRILWAALGPDWKVEYPIPTKQLKTSGYPSCYKVDIALPKYKIWIELDGWGHTLPDGIQLDKKKTDLLFSLGWNGLRFWNQEVEMNLPNTLSTIYKYLDTLHITLEDY